MRYNQKRAFLILVVVLCAVITASLLGFHYSDKTPHISFSDWVAVKPIEAEDGRFRFAVASMISAEETWVTYKELVNYVANHVGGETSMILRPSYSDVRILLEENKVDLAFVCTGTYMMCSQAGTAELIAVPEFKNDIKYRCLFVVGANSTISDIADLRGRTFAFTDPESNTGCIVPCWVIMKQGHSPETYFSKIIYTGSHDRSLYAIVKGVVDGAGVDSLVFYSFVATHPEMKDRLRIIWESETFGAPPIVVPAGMAESTKEQLREIFLSMSLDVKGRTILDGLGIEEFRVPKPGEYDSAHRIWDAFGDRE
jgi:phosphonate transport system substrate-binding protein